ncbi:MAG TPA: hypothetical protein VLL97_11795 [Acidobacteriota bacterium]|nr:hypothetical protein [Acidobacteriota bacterium]
MVVNALIVFLIGLGLSGIQDTSQTVLCILSTARNGEMVKVRGEVFSTAHDVFIRLKECPENQVILVDGDDPSLGEAQLTVTRDDSFRKFEKYSAEEQLSKVNEMSRLNPKYRVTADFEGRLEIAASAGLKKDSMTGKVIGIEGFGHPRPFTRYRLVVTSVSNVEASERPTEAVPGK